MKNQTIQPTKRTKQRGQSLVEVALFFPIFIMMLAGLVEVANILVTQNRVTSATRASTRFGANGGQDDGMANVLLNTVTQTLQLEENVWDVWSIRGTMNENGDAVLDESWEFNHIYGISSTQAFGDIDEDFVKSLVAQDLQVDENGNTPPDIASGLRFVGTYAIHDVNSILGLDSVPQLVGFTSVEELAVMRTISFSLEATDGCDGFPIAVHEGIRSVTPGTGANPYPQEDDFTYPNAGPPDNDPTPLYEDFFYHTPDTPLLEATEGDVFKVQNGFGAGNFGWLAWNTYAPSSANALADSLTWPGNSKDYTTNAPGPTPPGFDHGVYGYIEPGDPTDTEMQIGDWVAGSTGSINSNAVKNTMEGHIDLDRTLRLIVWSQSDDNGSNGKYLISGFAIFRIHGYSLNQSGGGSWILAEFISWDNSCGQAPAGP